MKINISANTKTVILNIASSEMIELNKAVNDAKTKLGLSNSELSKLIGHSRNYISETLRIGASTEKQAEIVSKIREDVAVELVSRGVRISCDDEQKQNVRMLNMEVAQLEQAKKLVENDLAIANRHKNFMKKKLQDKNAVINWLVASNVFFILFLAAKCVGWV